VGQQFSLLLRFKVDVFKIIHNFIIITFFINFKIKNYLTSGGSRKLENYVLICKLQVIEGARIQGAAKIIGIDKNERKKIKGKAFGMTDFINPDECDKSISELIKEITGGMGVDYCFECTGVAPLVNQALLATKMVCLSI
jgi:hypothetical protein